MSNSIIDNDIRKEKGLPELSLSNKSGNVYVKPKDLVESKKGSDLINKLASKSIVVRKRYDQENAPDIKKRKRVIRYRRESMKRRP